jgi:hypothetical protein
LRLLVLIFDFDKWSDQIRAVARVCRKQAVAVDHGLRAASADPHVNEKQTQHGGVPMFVKITIAVALILATASGALAASKQKHNTKRAYNLYDTHRQYGGNASRAKTVHAKTTHVKIAHAKAAHVKTTHAKGTQVQATQVQATQVQAKLVQATQVEAAHAKGPHVKRTHAKAMQKHRAKQAYASYESHNWSFGSATSALAMVSPKQNSSRYFDLYNTRAQYTGLASGAAETPRPRHSSNLAYDVYSIRGWYIGSDPDPTIRFMLAMDPASSD